MAQSTEASSSIEQVDLKDPGMAALLAWLMPGAGHFYQGRHAKGVLFLVCILGLFACGMSLSDGRCVYFQWDPPNMRRWSYWFQAGVGLPALPALVGTYRANDGKTTLPFLSKAYYMPPRPVNGQDQPQEYKDWDDGRGGPRSEYDVWSRDLSRSFELGTVFAMIAGLLNVLVVYDAWQGPAFGASSAGVSRRDEKKPAAAT